MENKLQTTNITQSSKAIHSPLIVGLLPKGEMQGVGVKHFEDYTRSLFGEERYTKFLASFEEEQPVSIRLNPFKPIDIPEGAKEVPWCRNGYWLSERPDFTMDPLLHAGCYYVQEAGSMFLDKALQQYLPELQVNMALDLCAAPGGKSTLLRAALPEGSMLYSNEPDRKRANILMENLQKQGHPEVIVTNNYAKDYQKAKLQFDLILTDVPCSGEGMFRKDDGAIKEWSIQNVMKCQQLQRSIVEDIWPCLREGGILIYSTCTFNTRENEENVRWICEELGAEVLPIDIDKSWGIEGSLLKGFDKPVYRFIPGVTPSEGLFLCVLRKTSGTMVSGRPSTKVLHILSNGKYEGEVKGKTIIPDHAESLLVNLLQDKYPCVDVDRETALHYLHREAIILPEDAPRGYVIVTYKQQRLGFVKNLGNRANNLYPQEWKIRKSL